MLAGRKSGGVKGDVVHVYLTNKRLLFVGEIVDRGMDVAFAAKILGTAEFAEENKYFASLSLSSITSLSEDVAGLLKGKIRMTLVTKDGNNLSMALSKKEAKELRTSLQINF